MRQYLTVSYFLLCCDRNHLMSRKTEPGAHAGVAREFSLSTLAVESGVPERTIRYYIARGLLSPPARGGRGAFYTAGHLDRLKEIQQRQQQGLTLAEIERQAGPGGQRSLLAEPELWLQYVLAPDLIVKVRSGSSPWRVRQVQSALDRLVRELGTHEPPKGE
jgi:DNA-binding transcriptional MerR regulator